MKICWDNLNKLVYRHGVWRDSKRHSYIYVDSCVFCGDPFLSRMDHVTKFCSRSCSSKYYNTDRKATLIARKNMSIAQKKRYLGAGVVEKNLPLYDTFANKISFVEPVRFVMSGKMKLLEVTCKKCGSWFVPTRDSVKGRSRALNIGDNGQCDFYCSNECKLSCSVYGQILYPKNFNIKKDYTGYQLSIWSKEVLKRAEFKCEYCGEKATDAHHTRPLKLEPFFALDPDYGIACCEKCHYRYGHSGDCSTGRLAKEICN